MPKPAPIIPGRGGRPSPPAELSDREKEIWTACIESRPVNYFTPEVFDLLRAYAMHAVMSQDLAVELRKHPTDKLRKMFRQEKMSLCTIASKLRLASKVGEYIKAASRPRSRGRRGEGCGWLTTIRRSHFPSVAAFNLRMSSSSSSAEHFSQQAPPPICRQSP
jgi:hypothetical protein